MKVNDLTLALVITSNVIISCQSAAAYFHKRTEIHPQKINMLDRKQVFSVETYHQNRCAELVKRSRRIDLLRKWNIRPIRNQLDIIIDRYRVNRQMMDRLYIAAIRCGPNGCHRFNYIPTYKFEPEKEYFARKRRHYGKLIYKRLSAFYDGLQKIHRGYSIMIKYENSTSFYNKLRADLLRTLMYDIRKLSVEVEAAMNVKSQKSIPKKKDVATFVFPIPATETELIIQEWYVIKGSERLLKEWKKNLRALASQMKVLMRRGKTR